MQRATGCKSLIGKYMLNFLGVIYDLFYPKIIGPALLISDT